MSGIFDSMKRGFSSKEESEDESLVSGIKNFTTLSWKHRLLGFIICISLAAVFALLGAILAFVSPAVFAVLFSIGTICAICSTFFLVGPISQAKKLCDPNQLIGMAVKIGAIVLVVIMIALVFCSVFWWRLPGLAVLFCIIEFIAVLIYAITLIPYATTMISTGARGLWSAI